jgi:hypothetical protein
MNFSMKTRSSPKLDFASERARAKFRRPRRAVGDAHALAAAAGGGLDHHRVADLVGDRGRLLVVLDHAEMAGHGRDVGAAAAFLLSILSPMAAIALGFGPMKTMPALASASANASRSDKKAVARMHRLGAARLAGGDDLVDDQVALRRRRRADRDGLVGHLDVQRVAVGLGIDRDGGNPHPAGGLDDPAGDLAAVGNQDSLEHSALNPRTGPLALRRCRENVNAAEV